MQVVLIEDKSTLIKSICSLYVIENSSIFIVLNF
jgi:hypothetical protein